MIGPACWLAANGKLQLLVVNPISDRVGAGLDLAASLAADRVAGPVGGPPAGADTGTGRDPRLPVLRVASQAGVSKGVRAARNLQQSHR